MRLTIAMAFLALAACRPAPRAAGGPDSTRQSPLDAGARLEGPTWRLAEVGGRPVPASEAGSRPHIRLTADGRKLQGSAGCNRMMGTYELNGTSLKFGPIMTTKMACPAMETEQAFLNALDSTVRYEINGSSLTLYGPDEALARLEPGTNREN